MLVLALDLVKRAFCAFDLHATPRVTQRQDLVHGRAWVTEVCPRRGCHRVRTRMI